MLDTAADIALQAAAPVEPPPDVGPLTAEFIPPTTPIAHAWDAQIAQLRDLSVAKKKRWAQPIASGVRACPLSSITTQKRNRAIWSWTRAGWSIVGRSTRSRSHATRTQSSAGCLFLRSATERMLTRALIDLDTNIPGKGGAAEPASSPKKIEPSISKH
jgi:hypothetical protein